MLIDICLGNIWGDMSSHTRETKLKINVHIKAFAQFRNLSTKQKDHILNGIRHLQMIHPIKELISKI